MLALAVCVWADDSTVIRCTEKFHLSKMLQLKHGRYTAGSLTRGKRTCIVQLILELSVIVHYLNTCIYLPNFSPMFTDCLDVSTRQTQKYSLVKVFRPYLGELFDGYNQLKSRFLLPRTAKERFSDLKGYGEEGGEAAIFERFNGSFIKNMNPVFLFL